MDTTESKKKRVEKVNIEKRYEEIGINYRFFLGWRQAIFAGLLAILYGVTSFTLTVYKELPHIAFIIPFVGLFLVLVFWGIEFRNRDLYHVATRSGKILEGDEDGMYTKLVDREDDLTILEKIFSPIRELFTLGRITQSAAFDLLVLFSLVLFLFLGIYLYRAVHV